MCVVTVAHVYEETCDAREGVEFLTRTRSDWEGMFAGHITWHLTLLYFGACFSLFSKSVTVDRKSYIRTTYDNTQPSKQRTKSQLSCAFVLLLLFS